MRARARNVLAQRQGKTPHQRGPRSSLCVCGQAGSFRNHPAQFVIDRTPGYLLCSGTSLLSDAGKSDKNCGTESSVPQFLLDLTGHLYQRFLNPQRSSVLFCTDFLRQYNLPEWFDSPRFLLQSRCFPLWSLPAAECFPRQSMRCPLFPPGGHMF